MVEFESVHRRDKRNRFLRFLIILMLLFACVLLLVRACEKPPPPPPPPTKTYTPTVVVTTVVPITPTYTPTFTPTLTPTKTKTPTRTPRPTWTPVPPIPTVEGNKWWWSCYFQQWFDYPRHGWSACVKEPQPPKHANTRKYVR